MGLTSSEWAFLLPTGQEAICIPQTFKPALWLNQPDI